MADARARFGSGTGEGKRTTRVWRAGGAGRAGVSWAGREGGRCWATLAAELGENGLRTEGAGPRERWAGPEKKGKGSAAELGLLG